MNDSYILDQILSGDDAETVVERIHEYLKLMGENIRGGKVEMEDFIVFKVCFCLHYLSDTSSFF